MALFGTFVDIPLCDLLSMVGKSRGVLEIEKPNRTFKAFFQTSDDMIVATRVIGEAASEVSATTVESIILEFLNEPEACFEFRRGELLKEGVPVSVRIDVLLLECMSRWDEMKTVRPDLSHPDTVFIAETEHVFIKHDIELEKFWLMARPLLIGGCSARETAMILNLELHETLIKIEKLSKLKVLKPLRLFGHDVSRQVTVEDFSSEMVAHATSPYSLGSEHSDAPVRQIVLSQPEVPSLSATRCIETSESESSRKVDSQPLDHAEAFESESSTLTTLIQTVMHTLRRNAIRLKHGT